MDDYKERMRKEYEELCDRIWKLTRMLDKYYEKALDFKPSCPPYLLEKQLDAMREYKDVLEARNYIEEVW